MGLHGVVQAAVECVFGLCGCSAVAKKDKLELQGLRNTHKVMNLLRLLAFQTGSEVSLLVLGRQLGMDKKAPWSII